MLPPTVVFNDYNSCHPIPFLRRFEHEPFSVLPASHRTSYSMMLFCFLLRALCLCTAAANEHGVDCGGHDRTAPTIPSRARGSFHPHIQFAVRLKNCPSRSRPLRRNDDRDDRRDKSGSGENITSLPERTIACASDPESSLSLFVQGCFGLNLVRRLRQRREIRRLFPERRLSDFGHLFGSLSTTSLAVVQVRFPSVPFVRSFVSVCVHSRRRSYRRSLWIAAATLALIRMLAGVIHGTVFFRGRNLDRNS